MPKFVKSWILLKTKSCEMAVKVYNNRMKIKGFFVEEIRLAQIDELGDPLEQLNCSIDWTPFETELKKWEERTPKKGRGGRPAYNSLMMFKILIIQKLYNLTDAATEYRIKDSFTFTRFLGLSFYEHVPKAKTIQRYRTMWTKNGLLQILFDTFTEYLEKEGWITHEASIVDTTFIDRSRQNLTKEEYEQIKEGKIPERLSENENRLRHVDTDARMGKKKDMSCNGYKMIIKMDAEHKLLVSVGTRAANEADTSMLEEVIDEKDRHLYADKGFARKKADELLPEGAINDVHEKAARNRPLTEAAQARNRRRSKVRIYVEHAFAMIKNIFKFRLIRAIGKERARGEMLLVALAYNLHRLSTIKRRPRRARQAMETGEEERVAA